MGLRGYIVKRVMYTIILVFVVISLNFMIFMLMPGDPMAMFAQPGKIRDETQRLAIMERFGLNDPMHIRYFKYVKNMLTFDFGVSYRNQMPISEEMGGRLVNTFILVGVSTVLSIIIGVVLGVYSAYKRGGKFDSVNVISALTFYSLPSFWMGMVLLLIFSVHLDWFPIKGFMSETLQAQWPQDWAVIIQDRLWHMFLPVLTLTLFMYGGYLLLTRAVMLETLTDDYVLTARAKGLKERIILFKHALKNASLPLITNIALSFAFVLTGAIITEQVFSWRGMGLWLWNSLSFYDYPVLQALFYLLALCVLAANFIADILYGFIDPRVKYS